MQKRQEGSKGIRSESGVECEAKMSGEDYKQVLESMQGSMDNDSGSNATPKPKKQKPDPVAKLPEDQEVQSAFNSCAELLGRLTAQLMGVGEDDEDEDEDEEEDEDSASESSSDKDGGGNDED